MVEILVPAVRVQAVRQPAGQLGQLHRVEHPGVPLADLPGGLRRRHHRVDRRQCVAGQRAARAGRLRGADPAGRLARIQAQQPTQQLRQAAHPDPLRQPPRRRFLDERMVQRRAPPAQPLHLPPIRQQLLIRQWGQVGGVQLVEHRVRAGEQRGHPHPLHQRLAHTYDNTSDDRQFPAAATICGQPPATQPQGVERLEGRAG
jgi:hypothetical protein